MHCPKCGHRQTSDKTSFCTKCGLAIGDVKEMLVPESHKNKDNKENRFWEMLLPELYETNKKHKKRLKIVGQGVGLIVFGLVLTFILEILQDFSIIPKVIVKIAFFAFLVAGILRMCIPFLFSKNILSGEKEASTENDGETNMLTNKNPTEKSLPEAQYQPPINLGAKDYDTAEVILPSSVTENTTKLLKKQLEQE